MFELPILYDKSKNGKITKWECFVTKDCEIHTIHGYEDGKKQEDIIKIKSGKNKGKINETTTYQQACNEAQSKWQKKYDSGYRETLEELEVLKIKPMLAHKFEEKRVYLPCYIQPKYDGVRCLSNKNGMISRGGKEFHNLQHIKEELKQIPENIFIDGELYSDEVGFQTIVSIVRRKNTIHPKEKTIFLRIYDVILLDKPNDNFFKRNLWLIRNIKNKFKFLKYSDTFRVEKMEEIKQYHDRFVFQEGYEGGIIRNSNGIYEIGERSYNLLKYKIFKDDEFEIIDVIDGKGREENLAIFVCKTKEGKVFNTRPKGSYERRRKWLEQKQKYIGKMLTVRFFEYTDDNIPRFPVGIVIRDYE